MSQTIGCCREAVGDASVHIRLVALIRWQRVLTQQERKKFLVAYYLHLCAYYLARLLVSLFATHAGICKNNLVDQAVVPDRSATTGFFPAPNAHARSNSEIGVRAD